MALPDLGSMKPDQLSKLTPMQLHRYNSPLPQDDPENPYVHQEYPKYMYGRSPDGKRIISRRVETLEEEAALEGDWRNGLIDWGIVTHPEVPKGEPGLAVDIRLSSDQVSTFDAAERALKKNAPNR